VGFLQHAGFLFVDSIEIHPAWNPFSFASHDLAVVRLSSSVDGVQPTPINETSRVPHGTQGAIAGFGDTFGGAGNAGIKRWGLATTAPCLTGEGDPSTHVCWIFQDPVGPPGEDSGTCHGDSGGPLFFATTSGNTILGGVTSFGNPNCLPPNNPHDADVFVDRAWIIQQAGQDLQNQTCGSLPAAGGPSAPYSYAEGTLHSGNIEDTWTFDVPPAAQALRVTLNAERPRGVAMGQNNFDLLIKHGSVPSNAGSSDCSSETIYAAEACEIPSPAGGTWYAKVLNYAGAGAYQLTITHFLGSQGEPSDPDCNGRASNLLLHNRFLITGQAFLAGNPADFFLQNICSPEGISPTALAFYFNAANDPRQEGFISITNNCDSSAETYKVEVASASTRKFTVNVLDTRTGLSASYSNANPGRSAFFPVDRTSFAGSCLVP
jgi:hypothetical protein